MSTLKSSLAASLLLMAAALPAEEPVAGGQEYQQQIAELEAMQSKRDLDLFEVTFDPVVLDRVVVVDRLGKPSSYGFLAFRVRNQVSAGTTTPISQSKGYNEVLNAIVAQYEHAKVAKENGVSLTIDGVQGKEGIIIERTDARTAQRTLDLSFQLTDENGSRQRILQDPTAPGAVDSFAFSDQGTTVVGSTSSYVRDRIEEVLGRRLLTVDEIRQRPLPPYDTATRTDEGWAAGEIWGVAIFRELPALGHRYTIDVRGLTNKFRVRWTPAEAGKPENYLDTVFYRRTFRLEYAAPGDEFARQEDRITLVKAGWEWVPTFQRSEQRRMQAYVRFFLNNLTDETGDKANKDVAQAAWEWYDASRAEPTRAEKLPDLKAAAGTP